MQYNKLLMTLLAGLLAVPGGNAGTVEVDTSCNCTVDHCINNSYGAPYDTTVSKTTLNAES